MGKSVFISHAGSDFPAARRIADVLSDDGHEPLLDRDDLGVGDDILEWMESSLASADYCLLLWSRASAESRWVRAEWQAALHRAIEEVRTFLLLGRLDAHPTPRLLAPRLWTTLHPELQPGLDQIRRVLRADLAAEARTERRVARAAIDPGLAPDDASAPSAEVYVTSELFGRTVPVPVRLYRPAGLLLESLITAWQMPRRVEVHGRVGLHLNYALRSGDTRLDAGKTLDEQGVAEHAVLRLETEVVPFAATPPASGDLQTLTFRAFAEVDSDVVPAVRSTLLRTVAAAGLGPVLPRLSRGTA